MEKRRSIKIEVVLLKGGWDEVAKVWRWKGMATFENGILTDADPIFNALTGKSKSELDNYIWEVLGTEEVDGD